jgi:hypothetical protein
MGTQSSSLSDVLSPATTIGQWMYPIIRPFHVIKLCSPSPLQRISHNAFQLLINYTKNIEPVLMDIIN